MKTSIIIVLVVSLFFKCKGQEEKLEIQTVNCESLITQQLDVFWKQLADFQTNYFPDENNQNYKWNYDFEKSKIEVFKMKNY